MPGWGNQPPGRAPAGVRADQPPPNTADDLHAIRERYCGPGTSNPQNLSLAANAGTRFDLTGTRINAIILTTNTGQLNVYLGDYSAGFGKGAVTPHIVGSSVVAPNSQVFPLAPREDYIICVQEGSGAAGGASGTILFIYE